MLDFDVYTGRDGNGKSDHGVAYGVVLKWRYYSFSKDTTSILIIFVPAESF